MSQWENDLRNKQWVLSAIGDNQWFGIIDYFNIVANAETAENDYLVETKAALYLLETITNSYSIETDAVLYSIETKESDQSIETI